MLFCMVLSVVLCVCGKVGVKCCFVYLWPIVVSYGVECCFVCGKVL